MNLFNWVKIPINWNTKSSVESFSLEKKWWKSRNIKGNLKPEFKMKHYFFFVHWRKHLVLLFETVDGSLIRKAVCFERPQRSKNTKWDREVRTRKLLQFKNEWKPDRITRSYEKRFISLTLLTLTIHTNIYKYNTTYDKSLHLLYISNLITIFKLKIKLLIFLR